MSAPAAYDPIQAAFRNVIRDFRTSVKDDVYQQILATKTIDDVYDATDKLQKEQAKEGHLRHLSKIQPFLENMRDYAEVIEVFLQAKPDVLALIWGPIKLLLQWTSALKQSFDAIVNTLSDVGALLPEFKSMATLFNDKPQINDVLLLFFRDIVDLYCVALKFFGLQRWKLVFESMWPRHREKIKVIMDNITRHTLLLRNEVRLEHIQEEYEARKRALQHFEAAEKAHLLQEYQAIKTDISPKSYESKLDWLRGRACAGTEGWLKMNDTYKRWIDVKDQSTKLLWLQGIPGAGKTFLSGLVVDDASTKGTTAYAFLTHNFADDTSALSVLHSLLFQLTTDNEGLREVICRSSRASLKTGLDATTDILITAIEYAEPAFVIVDGLDEIEIVERGRLLRQLIHVSETCKMVKILVSSRAENDISLKLKDQPMIRVDDHNAASIEHYVGHSMNQWFEESDFLPDTQSEIRALVAPLPSSSKGMFLYAKLVIRTIWDLDEIDDIRSELRVLPQNLDEAYSRIFARVNSRESVTKDKARRLLSWVGCSPTPLTVQELQAALLVRPDDADRDMRASGGLNVVKLCGPIVEIVDDYVQFVHFTVKEYIFSPKITDYIDIVDAKLELALCCLSYLRRSHHDDDNTDVEITQGILSGAYRLHSFAVAMWYGLVETYISSQPSKQISAKLINQLELFMSDRWVLSEPDEELLNFSPPALKSLKTTSPQMYACLLPIGRFRQTLSNSEFSIEDEMWIYLDPTSLSQYSIRVHRQLAELLICTSHKSDDCKCSIIAQHYGKRPFKCAIVSCPYHRYGFETHPLRIAHIKNHDRPWTCDDPDCEYANQGFLSRKMRDEHWRLAHCSTESKTALDMTTDDDDRVSLLVDLIEAEQMEHVRSLLLRLSEKSPPQLCGDSRNSVIRAVGRASPDIFRLITGFGIFNEYDIRAAFKESARAGNLETFTYIISNNHMDSDMTILQVYPTTFRESISSTTCAVLSSGDEMIWETWYTAVQSLYDHAVENPHGERIRFYWGGPLSIASGQRSKQDFLLRLLEYIVGRGHMSRFELGDALIAAANSGASLDFAEYLLDHGVDVNFRRSHKYLTPLHASVRRSGPEAAEMTRFLLFRGADPTLSSSSRSKTKIEDEKGAKNIQQWLGVTWEELLAETAKYRQGKSQTDE